MNQYQTSFKYALSQEDKERVLAFYHSLEHVSVFQHPDWAEEMQTGNKICFFILKKDEKIVAYSRIIEATFSRFKFLKTARIRMGLLFSSPDDAAEAILNIKKHYAENGYMQLSIQLAHKEDNQTKILTSILKSKSSFSLSNKGRWHTMSLDLSGELETIERAYSENHRRSIKKALKSNITVAPLEHDKLEEFIEIYLSMHNKRGIDKNAASIRLYLEKMYDFAVNLKQGVALAIFNQENKLIGGFIGLKESNSLKYEIGATDHDYRSIPILHLAFYEVIRWAKDNGFRYFDMGGYAPDASPEDQVYQINRFKNGFRGEVIEFPQIIEFKLKPIYLFILRSLQKL